MKKNTSQRRKAKSGFGLSSTERNSIVASLVITCAVLIVIFFPVYTSQRVDSNSQTTSVKKKDDSSGVITRGLRDKKNISMIINVYKTPESDKVWDSYTQLMNVAQETAIPVTVFATGKWLEQYSSMLERYDGVKIENYSYSNHAFHGLCIDRQRIEDRDKSESIQNTQSIIFQVTGDTAEYFQFPGGCYTDQDVTLVKDLGLQPIDGISFEKSMSVKNGMIIEVDITTNSPQDIREFIEFTKNSGYSFVSISDILGR